MVASNRLTAMHVKTKHRRGEEKEEGIEEAREGGKKQNGRGETERYKK